MKNPGVPKTSSVFPEVRKSRWLSASDRHWNQTVKPIVSTFWAKFRSFLNQHLSLNDKVPIHRVNEHTPGLGNDHFTGFPLSREPVLNAGYPWPRAPDTQVQYPHGQTITTYHVLLIPTLYFQDLWWIYLPYSNYYKTGKMPPQLTTKLQCHNHFFVIGTKFWTTVQFTVN